MVAQKAGEPYSNSKVQQTLAALNRTRLFSKVEVQVTPEAAGLRVTFVMEPAFYIGTIDFPGALKVFSCGRLLQVVNYPAEQPWKEFGEGRRIGFGAFPDPQRLFFRQG